MKLTTDKKYVLYYNFIANIYGYDLVNRALAGYTFWKKRTPIMYSDSFGVIDSTANKLNEELRA